MTATQEHGHQPDLALPPGQPPTGGSSAIAPRPEVLPSPRATSMAPTDLIMAAIQKGATPEALTQIKDLVLELQRWEARKAFDQAMADAKAEFTTIIKNRTVSYASEKSPTGKVEYQHEDLAQIAEQIGPILGKHGLNYRYRSTSNPNEPVSVTCIIAHRDGHREETTLSAGRDEGAGKNSIQAVGSTTTYLQRYTLKLALGLAAAVDDDGVAAGIGEFISETQLSELNTLAIDSGADIRKFCEVMKVPSLAEIPRRRFEEAAGKLVNKKAFEAAQQKREAEKNAAIDKGDQPAKAEPKAEQPKAAASKGKK